MYKIKRERKKFLRKKVDELQNCRRHINNIKYRYRLTAHNLQEKKIRNRSFNMQHKNIIHFNIPYLLHHNVGTVFVLINNKYK